MSLVCCLVSESCCWPLVYVHGSLVSISGSTCKIQILSNKLEHNGRCCPMTTYWYMWCIANLSTGYCIYNQTKKWCLPGATIIIVIQVIADTFSVAINVYSTRSGCTKRQLVLFMWITQARSCNITIIMLLWKKITDETIITPIVHSTHTSTIDSVIDDSVFEVTDMLDNSNHH